MSELIEALAGRQIVVREEDLVSAIAQCELNGFSNIISEAKVRNIRMPTALSAPGQLIAALCRNNNRVHDNKINQHSHDDESVSNLSQEPGPAR